MGLQISSRLQKMGAKLFLSSFQRSFVGKILESHLKWRKNFFWGWESGPWRSPWRGSDPENSPWICNSAPNPQKFKKIRFIVISNNFCERKSSPDRKKSISQVRAPSSFRMLHPRVARAATKFVLSPIFLSFYFKYIEQYEIYNIFYYYDYDFIFRSKCFIFGSLSWCASSWNVLCDCI